MSQTVIEVRDLVRSSAGRFVIKARLGSGGMGEVFLAEDRVLKRRVAMKAIRREHGQDTNFLDRLLKEAERASQLNDEHIARIHDIAEHDGRMFLIMEYVEGQTLRAKLREPLATEEFFSIAEQCLEGLAAAHRRGILHCDLKPENLMITPTGLVKILDFGFARRVASEETRDTLELSTPTLGGTLAYMAPEVLLGKAPDQRADIFSVGVVLYEALAGQHPFRADPTRGTAGRILREEPAPIPGVVSAGLEPVIARMLAKDPAQRYQSCAETLADIRAVHSGRKPGARKTGARMERPRQRIASLAVVVAMAGLVVLKFGVRAPWSSVPVAASSRQVVVLAFKPSAEDANSRAFANGLTETLTAKLGQIADRYPLEIVSTSDTRAQKVNDAQQARTILGATLALEGSLQQSGSTVRVIYSLVDTRTLRQVHSGVITADASNPFAVQDRVIEEVLNSLDIELAKQDRGRMQSHGTMQPQAYVSYLRGRGYLQGYDRSENLDNAIAALRRSLEADPKFALAYAGLGQAYMHRYAIMHRPESIGEAKVACARAAELDGSSPDGEICLGMLFNATGEYEKAAQHLERAVKLDASGDESYRALALSYEGLKRLNDAESALKRAIALRPQYWAGYKRLGQFEAAHGRYDEAIEQFRRVVELAPDSFSGYSNLGAVYVIQGKYAEAIDALERSITIRPGAPALTNLGAAYFYQRKYLEAAHSYERAAEMTPNEYKIFGNLGEAYQQVEGRHEESRKNYTQALKLAEQWLEVNAKDGGARLNAAVYAAMLGQATKAEAYRKSGLNMSSRDPEARKRSALVLAQLHKDSRALDELKRALDAGLSVTEITNNPAWQRFAGYPEYAAIIARERRKSPKR
jgi:tetratricopeptide (TPR) repeat protein/tRNA A-37 threonylcarbamoyl transferase component Bud32